MRVLLAPMEGLLDFALRDVLTRVGGIDHCVSEFIRVTDTLLPERAFRRVIPELNQGGRTAAGVPVRGQLLGSDPVCMAENAARLASLGPHGIDLNFGCPAKVVNRHGGGAALLKEPEVIFDIVRAVRGAVPAEVVVSAKMRLGYHDDELAEDCARAMAEAGASELVVHGRTKAHGYKPPAYWDRIADVRRAVSIPVIANGEIWTVADARRCQAESGCTDLMLGRGIVADPGLALSIALDRANGAASGAGPVVPWVDMLPLLSVFWQLVSVRVIPKYRAGRVKQWLHLMARTYPQADAAFRQIRTVNDSRQVEGILTDWITQAGHLAPTQPAGRSWDNGDLDAHALQKEMF